MLLNGCPGSAVAFDVGGNVDGLEIFKVTKAGLISPVKELFDRSMVSDPCILVSDGNAKKIDISFNGFRSALGNDGGNWQCRACRG